jgi:LemA protein
MIILPIVLVLVVLWVIGSYNGLIRTRNRVKEAWSDIDVQFKRRYDLIPNLVETVKGYATHEKEVFENVIKARSMAMSAKGVDAKNTAENELSGALKSLFAVAEAYPDLKASTNFGKLQDELTDTENKIQSARRFYNSNVLEFNTRTQEFPGSIIAGSFGFSQEKFFEVEESEREPVKVQF